MDVNVVLEAMVVMVSPGGRRSPPAPGPRFRGGQSVRTSWQAEKEQHDPEICVEIRSHDFRLGFVPAVSGPGGGR